MVWTLVVLIIVFACALLLISRLYRTRDQKPKETSDDLDNSTEGPSEADASE